MSSSDIGVLGAWVGTIVGSSPLYLTYLAAIIVAIVNWRQERVRSMITLAVALGTTATDLCTSFALVWLPMQGVINHEPARTVGLQVFYVALFRSMVHAVALAFLLYAVFSKRKTASGPQVIS